MGNAVVNVVHPTQRVDGSTASVADVATWRVEYKADAASTWSPLGGPRTPDLMTANVQNLSAGKYNFRAFWLGFDGQESDAATCDYDSAAPAPAKLAPGTISVSPA